MKLSEKRHKIELVRKIVLCEVELIKRDNPKTIPEAIIKATNIICWLNELRILTAIKTE